MSDARDSIAEAIARSRQVAAARMVRKRELEESRAKLERDREKLAAAPAGPEVDALRQEIDGRIGKVDEELAQVEAELKAAVTEMEDLRKLARGTDAATAKLLADTILNPDPILKSPEEDVLDRVREHIGGMEAEAKIAAELADTQPTEPLGDGRGPAATPPKPKPSKEQAEADARAEFQKLLESKPKKTL